MNSRHCISSDFCAQIIMQATTHFGKVVRTGEKKSSTSRRIVQETSEETCVLARVPITDARLKLAVAGKQLKNEEPKLDKPSAKNS